MANDNPITAGDASGGTLAMDEKSFGGSAKKFQRVTLASGENLAATSSSVTTTPAVLLAAAEGRVFAQVTPLNGDIYLAGSTGALATASTRRTVSAGDSWDTEHYVGDIAVCAVTGTVTVETEQVT